MKNKLSYYIDKFEYWLPAFGWSLISLLCWWVLGALFSSPWFDAQIFAWGKVLHKSEVLGYLQVLLAVQIPLFLLFIERMSNAGYINRKILPQVTDFRIILATMMVNCTLVLVAPREAYLYVPTVALFGLSVFGLYRASTVIFQPERYKAKIEKHLRNKIQKSFNYMLNRRISSNESYEQLEAYRYMSVSYFDMEPPGEMKIVELRAPSSGYLQNLDLSMLSKIFTKEFTELSTPQVSAEQEQHSPSIKLRAQEGWALRRGSVLARIIVPADYSRAPELTHQMLRAFSISNEESGDIQWFDDLVNEFEEQLNLAISQKNTLLLDQTLKLLRVLLDEADDFVESKQGNDFTLDNAFKEMSYLIGDDLSKRTRKLFDILSDLITKSFREDQPDVNRELVQFVYSKMLDLLQEHNVISVARYDRLLIHALYQFVFPNSWNGDPSAAQIELRDSLIHRLKEHSDLLRYELRHKTSGEAQPTIQQWFRYRISTIRQISMAAYKNKVPDVFEPLPEMLADADDNAYRERLEEELNMFTKCNIFMVTAYIFHRDDLRSSYGEAMLRIIQGWGEDTLTAVMMECISKKYADDWSIDTYDHAADGVVRSVPDYDDILRGLWVKLMLRNPTIVGSVDYYGDKSKFEQTLILTNGRDKDDDNPLLKLIDEQKVPEAIHLRKLVESFIKLRRDWENNKLAAEGLDGSKVTKFIDVVVSSYSRRSLVAKLEGLIPVTVGRPSKSAIYKRVGINQVFDKQAFIKEWHSGYITDPMAQQLGESIASNQDEHVFTRLLKKSETLTDIEALPSDEDATWLVVSNGVSQWSIARTLPDAISKDSPESGDIYFKNVKQVMPVQLLYIDDLPEGIYFIDATHLGKLNVKASNFETPVRIEIDAFAQSETLMDGIFKEAPQWLLDKGDKNVQTAFLRSKVLLLVERIFRYVPPKTKRSYFLKIDED